ncbi:MAG: M48 family metalloprotease, partial [Thermodesulfobacterium sp.]|nr:M48 family metalloprotease [Thermodesulfobacterium sp.]
PSLDLGLDVWSLVLLFLFKEVLFFLGLAFFKKALPLSSRLPRRVHFLIFLMIFSFFTADLSIFGVKSLFEDRYFGLIPPLLLFFHYYLPARILLYNLNLKYLRLLFALLSPLLLLYLLEETADYLSFDYPLRSGSFILLILLVAPALMVKVLPVYELSSPYLRNLIENFTRALKIKFRNILVLKPIGPRLYTAGVLGFFPPFRYLFFSEPLLMVLDEDEVLGVIAHEVAHLRNHHGLWLFLLLFSFPLYLLNLLFLFLLPFALIFEDVDAFSEFFEINKEILEIIFSFYLMIFAFFFFRYIFAYFLRSLEREADMFACYYLGSEVPLVKALYKVGEATGQLFEKSWHHYGLYERISFLRKMFSQEGLSKEFFVKKKRRIRWLILFWLLLNLFLGLIFQYLGAPFFERLLKFFLN